MENVVNDIIYNIDHKVKISKMTDAEYDAVVDRVLLKKDIRSSEDILFLTSILAFKGVGDKHFPDFLPDEFFGSDFNIKECEIFIGELYIYKKFCEYKNSDKDDTDMFKFIVESSYALAMRGSFYLKCLLLKVIYDERSKYSYNKDNYADFYAENSFLKRAFGGDSAGSVIGEMAFETFCSVSDRDKVVAYFYLEGILSHSPYLDKVISYISSIDLEAVYGEGKGCGRVELILAEYNYFSKSNIKPAIEYAKKSVENGCVSGYSVLISAMCSEINDIDYGCKDAAILSDAGEKVLEVIDLMREALNETKRLRDGFLSNANGIDFAQSVISRFLRTFRVPNVYDKIIEMASKGSQFEQYLVFMGEQYNREGCNVIADEQLLSWGLNAVNDNEFGGTKIPLLNDELKSELLKKSQ